MRGRDPAVRMRLLRWVTPIVLLAVLHAGAGKAPAQEPDPVEEAGCARLVDYGTAEFGPRLPRRQTISCLPLEPGTQRVFEGRSNATGAPLPHRVTFTVTELTKVVDGVRTAVVWDVDESDGELAETELAMFAAGRAGNVWNLGEYPEEYPGRRLRGRPEHLVRRRGGAEPGIHMPQNPTVGPAGVPAGLGARASSSSTARRSSSPGRRCPSRRLLLATSSSIHERSPLDPAGGIQVKYHAPDVGIVQIGAIGDPEDETLVLTEFSVLSPTSSQEANREAHILDQRGLQCSDVYSQTEPVEGPDDGDYGPYTCAAPRATRAAARTPAV